MQEINLVDLVKNNGVDEIFKQIGSEETTLKYSEDEAQEIVAELISKKANIEKLLTQYGTKLFSGEGKYSLLTQFHIQWVQSQDLEVDRIRRTFILKNAFASRSNENEVPAAQFLGKVEGLPIDIIDSALQRPNGMDDSVYIKFLSDLDASVEGSSRKTEIAILALKNLLELEKHFTDCIEERQKRLEKSVANLQGKLTEFKIEDNADKPSAKKISEFAKENPQFPFKALMYATNAVYKKHYEHLNTQTQEAANKYRQTLLAEEFTKISALEPAHQKVLEKVANNGRLRRAFVRDMVGRLYKDGKLETEAILAAEGKDNLSKIAGLMCHLNYKDMSNFNLLMSGVIDELHSQHNLDPSILGTANRGINWVMSYPIGLMYYVWDCLSVVLEFISVYVQKAAYGVYDWVKGNKEDREIEFNTFASIKGELEEALKGIKEAKALPEILEESKLKNAILEFLKDPNAADAENTLKGKINPDDFSGDLQEIQDKTALAKASHELLKHPQMNQGVDKYLENSWGSAAKSSLVVNALQI